MHAREEELGMADIMIGGSFLAAAVQNAELESLPAERAGAKLDDRAMH